MAKIFIIVGAALFVAGVLWHLSPGWLTWFGNLPGDIRVKGENYSFFFPITSMILVSLLVSVVVNLFFRN